MSIFSKSKPKERTEEVRPAEIKKGKKKVFSTTPHPGHTVWEYDTKSGILIPALIEEQYVIVKGESIRKRSVNVRQCCKYFSALNRKNAVRKLNGFGLQVND